MYNCKCRECNHTNVAVYRRVVVVIANACCICGVGTVVASTRQAIGMMRRTRRGYLECNSINMCSETCTNLRSSHGHTIYVLYNCNSVGTVQWMRRGTRVGCLSIYMHYIVYSHSSVLSTTLKRCCRLNIIIIVPLLWTGVSNNVCARHGHGQQQKQITYSFPGKRFMRRFPSLTSTAPPPRDTDATDVPGRVLLGPNCGVYAEQIIDFIWDRISAVCI